MLFLESVQCNYNAKEEFITCYCKIIVEIWGFLTMLTFPASDKANNYLNTGFWMCTSKVLNISNKVVINVRPILLYITLCPD